ncbi:MAG: hypothetical protein FD139_3447 [Methylocystaceae bacterium]|nr:MAG: hypothetical protein FD172_3799 [Methylocystaceae bacterium]TXT42675.1 MAG: hypothetical protein FD139_3447 [Methylocystaceae bacterium]
MASFNRIVSIDQLISLASTPSLGRGASPLTLLRNASSGRKAVAVSPFGRVNWSGFATIHGGSRGILQGGQARLNTICADPADQKSTGACIMKSTNFSWGMTNLS